jgi:glycosyltransferase involved in cell wall biosynthesis
VLEHPSYELLIVDNTPGERQVERLAREVGARYVVEPLEGLSRARTRGAREARGEIVAYIDDDAVAEPTWLARHAAALENLALGATTGRILPTSLETEASRSYAAAGGEDLGEAPFVVDSTSPAWFERANFGGVGIGCNMAFRRALFGSGWGFRESLGPGAPIPGEEHYAFFSLIRAGHAVAYVPEAVVHHDYPATLAELRDRRLWILRGAAAYMVMLLVEEPEFRRTVLRYMRDAAGGTRRAWRRDEIAERLGSRRQLLAAAAAGLPLYAWARLSGRGSFRPPPAPAAGALEQHQQSVPN